MFTLQSTCGNGIVESGEQCDDGGTTAGDGCSSACMIESGWNCSGSPSVCSPTGGTYTISFSFTGSGAMSCTPTEVSPGGSFECSLSPSSGYHLGTLTDNITDVLSLVSAGRYSVTNVTENHTVAAGFSQNLPVLRMSGGGEVWHAGIQAAYNASSSGDDVLIRASDFYGDLDLYRDVSVSLWGGYDVDFNSVTGVTVIRGSLTISGGTVTVDNLEIR